MQVSKVSRRQMFMGAGLRLGHLLDEGAAGTPPLVAGPSDAAFATYLNQYFPGSEQIKLSGVRSLSAIVVHAGDVPVKALALRWTVETATGTHSEVVFHVMPAFMSKDGKKNAGVARRKLLSPGRAVLLTPVTVVTSGAYARGYRPDLTKSLQTNLKRNFYGALASNVPASAVTVSVEGVYYSNETTSGVEGSALHKHVRLLQNAEHDQALSVIRPVRESTTQAVPKKLSQRRFRELSQKGSVIKRDYQQARKQHARRFVKLLQRHGRTALVHHLSRLLRYPKIHAGAEAKATV